MSGTFSPKSAPSFAIVTPNTLFLYIVQCIVNKEKTRKIALFPWDFVTLLKKNRWSHDYRQHAQKFGKDRACGSGDIFADRQTDRHRDMLITLPRNRKCDNISGTVTDKDIHCGA